MGIVHEAVVVVVVSLMPVMMAVFSLATTLKMEAPLLSVATAVAVFASMAALLLLLCCTY